ncbi:putative endonuclease 4 isoform 2-T2 [Leptodactylus fuscus]|uniref:putative endonuclease 4 isoform X2 n=1 Tax=Leptodactylus fuscus TaxID=238119 RepID=UPI003F4E4FB5
MHRNAPIRMDEHGEESSSAPELKKNIPVGGKVKRQRAKKNENPGLKDNLKSEPYKTRQTKKIETASKSRTQNTETQPTDMEPEKFNPQSMEEKDNSIVDDEHKKQVPDGDKTKRRKRKEDLDDISQSEPNKKQKSKKRETTDLKQNKDTPTDMKPETVEFKRLTSERNKRVVKKHSNKNVQKVEEGEVSDSESKHLDLSVSTQKYVGAHVSIQGGLWKAVLEAKRIGARAFGLFLRSQRTWNSKPLEEEAAEKFRRTCDELGFKSRYILPHSPYLMNLGSPKPDVFQKSRAMLVEELNRCQKLGLTLYNIHPGSHIGEMPVSKCLELIADGINYAHSQVPGVTVVLENMSCQGSTVGGRFEELRGIIDHIKDKSRIGVCLDTCHAFAAGHNLSEENGLQRMLDEFNKIVGLPYLKAVHLNDSKGGVGCRLDRHENIGRGHIGVEGFKKVMNEPRFNDIPMILETPASPDFEDYSDEIGLLYSFCE